MRTIDWNEMSRLGLLERINTEICHPLGLAICRDVETGNSPSILIADDGKWEYPDDGDTTILPDDEIREILYGESSG